MTNRGPTKTLILDRDGILIPDDHLMTKLAGMRPNSEVVEGLKRLGQENWQFIVASNQTVVARGLLSEKACWELHKNILGLFKPIKFLNSYLCFHHPKATLLEYRKNCSCRKPKPGMINQAIEDFSLNKRCTYFVGDRPSDVVAGNLAGIHSLQLTSEKSHSPMIDTDMVVEESLLKPLKSFSSFRKLTDFLISHQSAMEVRGSS